MLAQRLIIKLKWDDPVDGVSVHVVCVTSSLTFDRVLLITFKYFEVEYFKCLYVHEKFKFTYFLFR